MLGILEDDRQLDSSRVSLGGKFEFPQKARSHGLLHRVSMVVCWKRNNIVLRWSRGIYSPEALYKFSSRTTTFNVQTFFFCETSTWHFGLLAPHVIWQRVIHKKFSLLSKDHVMRSNLRELGQNFYHIYCAQVTRNTEKRSYGLDAQSSLHLFNDSGHRDLILACINAGTFSCNIAKDNATVKVLLL